MEKIFKKTSVLFIMSAMHGGGAEKVLIDYLGLLDPQQYDITLLLIVYQGLYLEDVPDYVKIRYLYKTNSFYPYRVEHLFSKFLHLKFLQKLRIKGIINQKFNYAVSFMEGIPLKFHSYIMNQAATNISWVHIDLFKFHYTRSCFLFKREEYNIYNKLDRIYFVSNNAMSQFGKLFNVMPKKEVIYNIIDREQINSLATQQAGINVCFDNETIIISTVGRLEPVKRHDRIIEVAKRLKSEGFNFEIWILGTGSLEAKLKSKTIDMAVEENVKFLGFRKPAYGFVKQSDIFISTSDYEGFSLVLCEALCLGTAIVSTRTAGPTEILENGKYGILCDFDNDSIYLALKSLMRNKDKLQEYKDLSLKRGVEFSTQKIQEQFKAIFRNE